MSSGSATMTKDYSINGNLQLRAGDFQINDDSTTTILNLTVNGNVNIKQGASITVGEGNTIQNSGYSIDIYGGVGGTNEPPAGTYADIYHQFYHWWRFK